MRLWSVAKHLLLATALVAGLALAACEASSGGTDLAGGGGGHDTSGGGGDSNIPLADSTGGDDTQVTPNCSCVGKECGDDGCGVSCGTCTAPESCNAATFQCECTPDCTFRQCGLDPVCGTSCGECDAGVVCTLNGQCPDPGCPGSAATTCAGRQCGPDGCGGFCAPGCTEDQECNPTTYLCEGGAGCECGARECGPKPGCPTESCGVCPVGEECDAAGMCGPPPGKDCIEWFACANACDPQSPDVQQCFIECDDELSETGLVAKNAFMSCQTNSCGHCTTNDCLNECVPSQCGTEYGQCIADSAHGTGSCTDYLACRNQCPDPGTDPNGFETCDNNCINAGSPEGVGAAYDIIFCVQTACADTTTDAEWSACVNEELSEGGACFAIYEACVGPVEYCDPATEDCLDCADLNGCLVGCGTSQECANNCFTSATEEANDQYAAAGQCLVENCPNGDIENCDQQAYFQPGGACEAQYNACFGGSAPEACDPADHPGEPDYCMACAGALQCVNGCSDDPCAEECVGRADETGFPLLVALFQCIGTECPTGEMACVQASQQPGAACADELQACTANAKAALRLSRVPQTKRAAVTLPAFRQALRLRAPVASLRK